MAHNGIGIVGVSWNVRILPCKFIDASGRGTDAAAVECFDYVVDQKARGVNLRLTSNSWGSSRVGAVAEVLKNAIDAAGEAGIVNVFAAGNAGTNNDELPADPASFTSPSIVSVAATDEYYPDRRVFWSNYGPTSVDLAAPGVNILSTYHDWYASLSGTSMATAYVAGAAALLLSHAPELSVAETKATLIRNVDLLPEWDGVTAAGGRVNVFRALSEIATNSSPTVTLTSPGVNESFTAPASISIAAWADDGDGRVVQVSFYMGTTLLSTDTAAPFEFLWTAVPAGRYALTAVAMDEDGATASSDVVYVNVNPVGEDGHDDPVNQTVGFTVEADTFAGGGQGCWQEPFSCGGAYYDETPGNCGDAQVRPGTDVDLWYDDGGIVIGGLDGLEWVTFPVNVPQSGQYAVTFRTASPADRPGDSGVINVGIHGVDGSWVGNQVVPVTGGAGEWHTYVTWKAPTTIYLPAGAHTLTMWAAGGWYNVRNMTFTLEGQPPTRP